MMCCFGFVFVVCMSIVVICVCFFLVIGIRVCVVNMMLVVGGCMGVVVGDGCLVIVMLFFVDVVVLMCICLVDIICWCCCVKGRVVSVVGVCILICFFSLVNVCIF